VPNIRGNAWGAAMAAGMGLIQDEAAKGRNHVLEAEFVLVLKEVNWP
jgi:hypothetical protein